MTREAWGEKFYLGEGHSLLGVIAQRALWFRDAKLIAALEQLRDDGFFGHFSKVVMTGGSMGGFGASTFAAMAPGCTVIAFSPQATLDTKIVPWECRFRDGQACDWTQKYSHAANGIQQAGSVYIFSDPLDRGDRRHTRLMATTSKITIIPIPAGGHGVQPMLIATGILKQVTRDCIAGTFDRIEFLRTIRLRKQTLRYHRMMVREAMIRDKPNFALKICEKAIKRFPEADFRELKSLALSRLGRPDEAFNTMMVARKVLIARLKS
ncbi:hypothetical protein [Paracoccus sp. Ld10]|uniref:hypothetical protein n=1 Tax=Paracoccus sp. Ld10 TaxID=649158 RepID=UPI00386AB882